MLFLTAKKPGIERRHTSIIINNTKPEKNDSLIVIKQISVNKAISTGDSQRNNLCDQSVNEYKGYFNGFNKSGRDQVPCQFLSVILTRVLNSPFWLEGILS